MSIRVSQILILFTGVLGLGVGCASVPPAPQGANLRPPGTGEQSQSEDNDDGRLFNWMMGRKRPASAEKAPSGVIPASATEPIPSAPIPSAPIPSAPIPKQAKAGDRRADSGFQWSDLSPTNIYDDIKKSTGYGPNEAKAHALMKEGESLFEKKQYDKAADKFEAAAKRWPDSPLEEDALFMTAESYFFADRYPGAQDGYETLLKKYDNSRHLDTSMKRVFAIGRYWEGLYRKNLYWPITPNMLDSSRPTFDTFGRALKSYEIIRLKDPIGPLADDSLMATANAHFRKGRFEDAAFHYDLLRSEYPDSEHQPLAHILGSQSKLRVYQGSRYDATPLKDADNIIDQALSQFRDQLGDEGPRMAEASNRIVELKAERDWDMGQYYDKQEYFGAARIYYENIIKEFPRTKQAQTARKRLEQIRGEPNVPPNRYKWLTDRFQSDD